MDEIELDEILIESEPNNTVKSNNTDSFDYYENRNWNRNSELYLKIVRILCQSEKNHAIRSARYCTIFHYIIVGISIVFAGLTSISSIINYFEVNDYVHISFQTFNTICSIISFIMLWLSHLFGLNIRAKNYSAIIAKYNDVQNKISAQLISSRKDRNIAGTFIMEIIRDLSDINAIKPTVLSRGKDSVGKYNLIKEVLGEDYENITLEDIKKLQYQIDSKKINDIINEINDDLNII